MCLGLSTMYNVYTVNKNDSFACTKKLQNRRIKKIMQRIKNLKLNTENLLFVCCSENIQSNFFTYFQEKKLL